MTSKTLICPICKVSFVPNRVNQILCKGNPSPCYNRYQLDKRKKRPDNRTKRTFGTVDPILSAFVSSHPTMLVDTVGKTETFGAVRTIIPPKPLAFVRTFREV
jgi:hypothetical protein